MRLSPGRAVAATLLALLPPQAPLALDPRLSWSTHLGGNGDDDVWALTADAAGNVYVAGTTYSTDFPVTAGGRPFAGGGADAFVAKLDPSGARLVFATHLGGSDGDAAGGIAVDPDGNVYVTGWTYSSDFPVLDPIQTATGSTPDAFVVKLAPDGSLLFASYLGGDGADLGHAIAVAPGGDVVLTGDTSSRDFPLVNPIQMAIGRLEDGFVTRLGLAPPAILYSTYLGGNDEDHGAAVAVDAGGNAWVAGTTRSGNFPRRNAIQGALTGASDGFVARLGPAGALLFSTYLGGDGIDPVAAIVLDQAGDVWLAGHTSSTDFPTPGGFQTARRGPTDGFVARLTATPSLSFASYLGGGDEDDLKGIAIDPGGDVVLAGLTLSADFPLVDPVQAVFAGVQDAVVVRLDAARLVPAFSSYLGGASLEWANGVGVDAAGGVAIGGFTLSADFPLVRPLQPALADRQDAFVAKLCSRVPQGSIGNRLFATRRGTDVDLDWRAGPLVPATYNLHRERTKTAIDPPVGPPLAPVTGSEVYTDPGAAPGPAGETFYYEAYGRDCAGNSLFD